MRIINIVFLAVLLAGSVLLFTVSARAAVVYDNLGSAPYSTFGYATFGLFSDGVRYQRGMQFTPSQTVNLTTLELALGQAFFPTGNPAQPGTAKVRLMTDSSNAPGSVLETWTSANISGGPGNASAHSFTSVLNPSLTAGTPYWILLSDAEGSNLSGAWPFADDNHTGLTRTVWVNENTGSSTFATLTRGYRTRVTGVSPEPAMLYVNKVDNQWQITWTGIGGALQASPDLSGTYTNVPGAVSPYPIPVSPAPQMFYRLRY